jgi:hypothetical protein
MATAIVLAQFLFGSRSERLYTPRKLLWTEIARSCCDGDHRTGDCRGLLVPVGPLSGVPYHERD